MIIGRKSILGIIGACIVIVFIGQAHSSLKDEVSPLYNFKAVQVAKGLGLAPTGSANRDLDFSNVATADLAVTEPGGEPHNGPPEPGGRSHNGPSEPSGRSHNGPPQPGGICCPQGCSPGEPGCPPCHYCSPQPQPDGD